MIVNPVCDKIVPMVTFLKPFCQLTVTDKILLSSESEDPAWEYDAWAAFIMSTAIQYSPLTIGSPLEMIVVL